MVSCIATVGNYEYGFFWYFYLDGTIEFEVKLTGILSTMAVAPGELPRFASMVAPQLAAPFHQHLFNVRLDVRGRRTRQLHVRGRRPSGVAGPGQPVVECVRPRGDAARHRDAGPSRHGPRSSPHWKIVNPDAHNRLGFPVGYKLVPGPRRRCSPTPSSSVARSAGFATHNLWVTPLRA